MTLDEYIQEHGPGTKRRIAEAASLRWATVHDIARGATTPRPATAKAIEKATGGAVSAAELLGLSAA